MSRTVNNWLVVCPCTDYKLSFLWFFYWPVLFVISRVVASCCTVQCFKCQTTIIYIHDNTNSRYSFVHLPDFVMIISVPSSWNLSHSSLVSKLHEIFAISSLGMPGLVGMSGSVHTAGALPLKSACPSREDMSPRDWLHEDFSTNCSTRITREVCGELIMTTGNV